ncbi:hypothetical protein R3P38DRAFT_2774174 [Favolaschia claudopus]|uniref:Uncharacterized protein n=1 Tax=Favolaschia claudopus TaxID=2862362 RepID=A0AAW0BZU4_9AGAR
MTDTTMSDSSMLDANMTDAVKTAQVKTENVETANVKNGKVKTGNGQPGDGGDPGNGGEGEGEGPEEDPNLKKALSYEVYGTSVISGLPPVQKERLVGGWRRRHLEEEGPERTNAEDDEEVHARTRTSYDISCQYLKNAHAMALYQAEERAEDLNFDTDSDDDGSIHAREELKPEDIIIWDGTNPTQTAHTTDAGAVADRAVAKDVEVDSDDDSQAGTTMAMRSVLSNSNADNGFFNFVPASMLAAAVKRCT